MAASRPSVVYVLPDKMGGVVTIVGTLLECRAPDEFDHEAVLTWNPSDVDTRFGGRLAADRQVTFEFGLPFENVRAVTARLARTIGSAPGVLVANDVLELAMLTDRDPGRTVFQVLHGDSDYYYDLAVNHEPLIHGFIAPSRAICERLRRRLPHRTDTIFHVPHGVPAPPRFRTPFGAGPLRLLYAGRLERQKGIFDLVHIDHLLREQGVDVRWTVIGGGPDAGELRRQWGDAPRVEWIGVVSTAQVRERAAAHDLFVLPTKGEGLSIALLEAMSVGLVPVVSAIDSGVAEAVPPAVGCTPAVGDVAGFAAAIASLAADRGRLEAMSAAARALVAERFDARRCTRAYQDLFARWRELYRPRPDGGYIRHGSRLDHPWMPNAVVRTIRSWHSRSRRLS